MLRTNIGKLTLINFWLMFVLLCVLQPGQAQEMPHPFAVAARSAVLIDATSGEILYGQNAFERIAPASFVKLLTLYLIFEAIDEGQIRIEDTVWISEKAWRTGGSKMFVRQGNRIPLVELIKGIAVVSGNDACVAAAEFLQGSEQAFVEKMNAKLRELLLEDSRFQTVNGWPAPDQYTTAKDMAFLALAYVQGYPQALQYHQLKEFSHENIRQRNRNGLLWRDPSVDGLKTGYIEKADYHLLATAKRGEQRYIAVVMGAESVAIREREALRLLNYGFRNFVTVPLFKKGEVLAQLPVWKGIEGEVNLTAGDPGLVTIPIAQKEKVSWETETPELLLAPIHINQPLGRAVISSKDRVLKNIPLLADREIPQAGFLKRTLHAAALLSMTHGRVLTLAAVALCLSLVLVLYIKHRRPKRRRGPRR